MRGEGFTLDDIEPMLDLFIHSPTAGKEIKLSVPADFHLDPKKIKAAVDEAGTALSGAEDLILTTIGLMVHAPVPHYPIDEHPAADTGPEQAIKNSRSVFLSTDKGTIEAPVYDRARLRNTHQVEGPAIVESEHTTFLIPDGWRLTVDRYNNALLEVV
jgi:N-methylhydantoinase A/oxoprolinase/acetone carboxylase beta subunit